MGSADENRRKHKFNATLKAFFHRYDTDKNGTIDDRELKALLADLGEKPGEAELAALMAEMDKDGSGAIDFDEFTAVMLDFVRIKSGHARAPGGAGDAELGGAGGRRGTALYAAMQTAKQNGAAASASRRNRGSVGTARAAQAIQAHDEDEEEEEEEEEIPEDLADLPPDVQRRKIIQRSLYQMGVGTVLVLLFSDPMVDCLSELGKRMGLPAFYVAFVLAPLASNASELLASYNYALKKTTKTITIAFAALEGAAIMNNTFCLGIFLGIVYGSGLEWTFTAETLSILLIEILVCIFAFKPVQTMVDAWIVLSFFPLSVIFVAVLESKAVGLN
jgi:ribosomal protein L12E/L44/L45/RPP1/RPP2